MTTLDEPKLLRRKTLAKNLFGKSLKYDFLGHIGFTLRKYKTQEEFVKILKESGFPILENKENLIEQFLNKSFIYHSGFFEKGFNTTKIEYDSDETGYLFETFCN